MLHTLRCLTGCALLALIVPASARELRVVGAEFASVYERNAAGEFGGLGVEIVKAIALQTGDTVRFEMYPWARAQLMVERNEADILVGPYKTREREARFSFAARGFYRDYMVFYVRNGSGYQGGDNGNQGARLQWDGNYRSLRGRKIVVVNGWTYGPKFESARSFLQPEVANSLTNALNMLHAGRIDYLASNLRNTEALLKTNGLGSEFTVLDQILDTQDGYLAYCRQSACDALRRQFDQGFEHLRSSGELAKMARGYNVLTP
ncbi:substrate-binding periplasmic protein [Undibacterium sp.]|jgi:polar amino acid transport system substrate-binding protein|uniref:substrate-binding periplasmic protein n=1 Tax=Undibacterium sp. TaxID=1914977 RepID=UPI002BBD849A|nr:transporter substrate-binding domain-containing protein [Undibacterium sp.]HTD03649.1 transporter substrate-binding domain-containing protein [Undibacterium sp.]